MGIIDNVKEAADLAKKVGDIELYRRIVHLEGEVMELTREKRQLEEKVEELEKKLALQSKMTFRSPFWYQEGDNVPFCQRCYEKDSRAMHLVLIYDREAEIRWDCPDCHQMYLVVKPRAAIGRDRSLRVANGRRCEEILGFQIPGPLRKLRLVRFWEGHSPHRAQLGGIFCDSERPGSKLKAC